MNLADQGSNHAVPCPANLLTRTTAPTRLPLPAILVWEDGWYLPQTGALTGWLLVMISSGGQALHAVTLTYALLARPRVFMVQRCTSRRREHAALLHLLPCVTSTAPRLALEQAPRSSAVCSPAASGATTCAPSAA